MLRRILGSDVALSIASSLATAYLRLVYRTGRVIGDPVTIHDDLHAAEPFIAAMWHGQFLLIPPVAENRYRTDSMVARHGDAELIGRVLRKFDLGAIRGAGAGERRKDRGGVYALRAALTSLRQGKNVAMTAEVPPGPARKAGLGIVTLGRMSGRPVIPIAIATSRFLTVSTWSRFTINLPFSKIGLVRGEAVQVPPDADEAKMEACRQAIEISMNAATRRAYELVGRDVAEATPVSAGGSVRPGLSFRVYRTFSRLIHPLAGIILRRRSQIGKEVAGRLGERMGIASVARPDRKLIWFHAASVGETNVVLPLIHTLSRERPDLSILLTTVTVTSSRIAAKRLPPGAIHQFIPLDTPAFVERFLKHWRPDLALFIESEIWPNLIMDADRRRIPLVLLNARMSERSFRRWLKLKGLSRPIFSRFAVVVAQSETLAKQLVKLGARKVIPAGNLKFDSPPPPVDQAELAQLRETIGGRPVFLAASTHPGEDEIIAEAHKALRETHPDLLTVIVPRHPERGDDIAAMLTEQGCVFSRRSARELIMADTELYLADTLGELGLFYSLAGFAFIGGSLVPHGGQNPIEAVKLGAGVVTGPHWHSFPEVYQALAEEGGCRFVTSREDLIHTARALFDDPASLDQMKTQAAVTVESFSGALDRTLKALEPVLPPRDATAGSAADGAVYAS